MFEKGLSDSFDTESRDQEIKLGFYLMLPSLLCIVIPAACLFAYSLYTGHDETKIALRFINEYHVALFIPVIMVAACVCASLYLIVVKDAIRIVREWRVNQLSRFDEESEMSEGAQRAIAGFIATSLIVLATGMFFWHG